MSAFDRFELRRQDYSLTPEQEALRESFGRFFAAASPEAVVRRAEPVGFDPDLWESAVGMGITDMALPGDARDAPASLVDLTLVAEEMGAAAAPIPMVSHLAATRAIARSSTAPAILSRAREARHRLTLALSAVADGQRQLVPDAAIARDVVALVDRRLVVSSGPVADHVPNQGSTPLGWWSSDAAAEISVIADGDDASRLFARARAEWMLLTSAALVGLTRAALDEAVKFAKTRGTLGVPIGTLQGISFPLADVAIGVSGARNLVWRAAWMLENEPETQPELPSAAFVNAVDVATTGTATAAHVQGGLGYATESKASLYVLRAKGWGLLGGDPQRELLAVADALIDRAGTSPALDARSGR